MERNGGGRRPPGGASRPKVTHRGQPVRGKRRSFGAEGGQPPSATPPPELSVDLADAVGLSQSPCLRRVRALEEAGVITGYRATLDRPAVGLGLTVFVGVKVARHTDADASTTADGFDRIARERLRAHR